MINRNKFHTFLRWWWQGLAGVWKAGQQKIQVLEFGTAGWQLIGQAGEEPLAIDTDDSTQLATLAAIDKIFLLAPPDKVINTAIPETQRSEPLTTIVESLLPFKAGELHFSTDSDRKQLYAVSKTDTEPFFSKLEALKTDAAGVAFSDQGAMYYSQIARALKEQGPPARVLWVASALAALILLTSFVGWQLQAGRQTELASELQQLQMLEQRDGASSSLQAPTAEVINEIERALQSISIRDADRVSQLLQTLVRNMPIDAEFKQLILTDSELIIDGHATSASEVQTELEKLREITSSEFITAISTSNDQQSERFRLKLTLPRSQQPEQQKPL